MSDPVSALNGAEYHGLVDVADAGLTGMITLRGNLGAAKVKKAVKAVTGTAVPAVGEVLGSGETATAWMSPDELLLIVPYAEVAQRVAKAETALAGEHAMVVDVSDARAVLTVTGSDAREVMAKLCPVDLSPAAFGKGDFRRTRMAQIPAALWMTESDQFTVICFRSVADYAFALLKVAAQPGSAVGAF